MNAAAEETPVRYADPERRPGTPIARVGPARHLGRVVWAEWIKARSVPWTWTALGSFVTIMVGIGAALTQTIDPAELPAEELARFEPLPQALAGITMGQVALGVLGALLVTGEYSSRLIAPTLTAVPQRWILLTGKVVLLVLLVTPFALAAVPAGAAFGLAVLDDDLAVGLTDPGVPAALLGTVLSLVLVGLLGLGAGVLLRSTAGAVIALTFALFLLPVIVQLLPSSAAQDVLPWLPGQAGAAVLQLREGAPGFLSPAAGLAVAGAYTAVMLAAAAVVLGRRDA